MNCAICGKEAKLVEAVGEKEIINVCEICAEKEGYPIIRKPNIDNFRNMSRFKEVSGDVFNSRKKDKETEALENELKEIVRENVKAGDYPNLIDNFHWHIQKARRMKKLSQKQLGEMIAEPDVIIEMAEKGKFPENYMKVVRKLEQFLGIKIIKNEREIVEDKFDIKKTDLGNITGNDLKKMKEEMRGEKYKEHRKEFIETEEDELINVSDDFEDKYGYG